MFIYFCKMRIMREWYLGKYTLTTLETSPALTPHFRAVELGFEGWELLPSCALDSGAAVEPFVGLEGSSQSSHLTKLLPCKPRRALGTHTGRLPLCSWTDQAILLIAGLGRTHWCLC